MSREMKVTPQEVLEELQENEYSTKEGLSEMFDCCVATIRSKLRVLREDGEPIIHS